MFARYGLSLGANFSLFVQFLLLFFYPIAYPTGKLLDWLLGKGHFALLRRAELKTLVDLHADEAGKGGEFSHHETPIISGALDLTQKTAKDAMIPLPEIFSLDINSKLDMHIMGSILSKGHSSIPIYSGTPNNVLGIILVKNLIFCHPEDETPIKQMNIRRIPRVHEDWPLYNILAQFKRDHSHMAVVVKSKKDVKITTRNEVSKSTMLNTDTNSNSKLAQAKRKGISSCDQTASISISTDPTSLYSSNTEFQNPAFRSVIEQHKDWHLQVKNWEEGVGNISYEDLESFPSNLEEEVVGIITMEYVIEELLQEEILDETDEYVTVHNKIGINLPPLRTSSGSHGRVSVSHFQWIPPNIQPLLERQTLHVSSGKT